MTPAEESALAMRRVLGWTAVPVIGSTAIWITMWEVDANVVHWSDAAASFIMGSIFGSAAWSGLWVGVVALYKHALTEVRKEARLRENAR
jgi:acyl dehydratase